MNHHDGNRNLKTLALSLLLACFAETAVGQEQPNPIFQANQFNTSVSFRQDLCARYTDVDEGRLVLKDSIRGLSLTTVSTASAYFLQDEETGAINKVYPGIMPVLMDELCARAGCTWRDSFAVSGSPPEGKTWTDLLKWTTETYDLSLDWWMASLERLTKGIANTEPWYDASIIMVTRKQQESTTFDAWAWLTPFDDYVWFMLVVSCVVTGAVYYFLAKLNHEAEGKRKIETDPFEATFLVAVTLTSHFGFEPRTTSARLLAFSVAFFGLVISASYTANLASFLVSENRPQNQYNSLEDAVRANVPICIGRGTQTDISVSTVFPMARYVYFESEQGVIEGLRDGDCEVGVTQVSAWNRLQRSESLTAGCSLEWQGRAFQSVPAGFATKADSGKKCTNLLRDVINIYMTQMRVEGFISEAWDEHLDQTSANECTAADIMTEEESSDQLTLHNMGGIFVFHAILTGAALIMAISAWFWERRPGQAARQAAKKEKRRETQKQRTETTSTELPESARQTGPSIPFDSPDDSSEASELSDVEFEHLRKSMSRLAAVQKRDMIASEEKLNTMMAILQRIEGQKNESSNTIIFERE